MKLSECSIRVGLEGVEVQGEIIKISPFKTGKSEFGEYSIQNVVLRDNSGEATISLWNRKECKEEMLGKTIQIFGAKVVEDKYGIKVKVNKQCEVREIGALAPKIEKETSIKERVLQAIDEFRERVAGM